MPLSFRCPGCGISHTVSGKMAGKQVRCKCGLLMGIPADPRLAASSHSHSTPASAQQPVTRQVSGPQPTKAAAQAPVEIPADCPGCGKRRMVPATFRGKKVRCPCGTAFQISAATSTPTPQTPTPQTPTPQTPTPQTPTPQTSKTQTSKTQTPASQASTTQVAEPRPTNTAANTPGSLFDELTEDDLSGDVKLQPLEPTVANPSQDHLSRSLSNPSLGNRSGATSREAETTERHSTMESIGYGVFFVLCGWPGLELNGFGFGLPITLPIALACATLGGLIGGALVCPRPLAAGMIGGVLAGPPGLVAVYLYTIPRETVYSIELVIIQGLASLPGVGVGFAIRKLLTPVGRSRATRF